MRIRLRLLAALLPVSTACSGASSGPCDGGSSTLTGCVAGHAPEILGSSELPPTTSRQVPKSPHSLHLALDASNVFFTTLSGDIMRVAKSGGAATKLAAASLTPPNQDADEACIVTGLVVADGHVYWSSACGALSDCEEGLWFQCATRTELDVASEDGSVPARTVISSQGGHVDAIAAAGSAVLAALSDASGTVLFDARGEGKPIDRFDSAFPAGIATAEDGSVLWAGRTAPQRQSEIHLVTVGPSSDSRVVTTLLETPDLISDMTVHRGSLYWIAESTSPGLVTHTLTKKTIAPLGEQVPIVSGDHAPRVFAIDDSGIYGAGSDDDFTDVARYSPTGTRERVAVAGDMRTVRKIAVDESYVYWVDFEQSCTKWPDGSGGGSCLETKLVSNIVRVHKP